MNSQPKRKRIKLSYYKYQKLVEEVLERDEYTCQNPECGMPANASPHHRILRSQSGDDSLENLVSLCSICHRKVHDHKLILEGETK